MWLIRVRRNEAYHDAILKPQKVFLPWEGYHYNFKFKTKEELRTVVGNEKRTDNKTSVVKWVGQVLDFVQKMRLTISFLSLLKEVILMHSPRDSHVIY